MNNSTARIGYARVSTVDQNPDAQIAALEAAGCTMIRTFENFRVRAKSGTDYDGT